MRDTKDRTTKAANENAMVTGVIWKEILIFFFPILIGAFFQQLYNTVDAVVVGRFAGTEALASVGGSSGQITNFIFSFFMGLATGATVTIAQYYGAGNREMVDRALHTAYTFALVGGLALGALGIFLCRPFLALLNTPEALMDSSASYVSILMGGLVFTLLYNMSAGILRAIGDSKRPLYILIACCILNIFLDVFFVAVLHMGVAGAGIATVLCQAFSAVLVTWLLARKTQGMQLSAKRLGIRADMLGRILKIGLPTAIAGSMFSISNMIVQTAFNRMGVDVVAAWTAYGKIDALWWMVNQAFSTSITTFVGQNFGAGKPDRIRKGVREVLLMEIGTGLALGLFFITAAPMLLRLFADSEEVIAIGVRMSRRMAMTYWVFAFSEILSATLRAENYVLVSTITNLVGVCVFRIVWVLFIVPNGTMEQLILCYPVSWVITSVLVVLYYLAKQPGILRRLSAAQAGTAE